MWRLTMFVMCLIAALSGTLLRQAEAANDFARCVAEFEDDQNIETIDGGVGDDLGSTILKARGPHTLQAMLPPTMMDGFVTVNLSTVLLPSLWHRNAPDRVTTLSAGSVRKHVWLACFLF